MPAVRPMASAPQNVTRRVALTTSAPPARAPMAPSSARKASEAKKRRRPTGTPEQHHHRQRQRSADRKRRRRRERGQHRARRGDSEMPSSSRACAPSASFAISCRRPGAQARARGHARRRSARVPRAPVRAGVASSALSRARSACSVSACELTETYSPAAIDMAPGNQAGNASHRMYERRCRCRRHADDQAGGRDNAVIGAEHGGAQPADARDEMVFRMEAKPCHCFRLSAPWSFAGWSCNSVSYGAGLSDVGVNKAKRLCHLLRYRQSVRN